MITTTDGGDDVNGSAGRASIHRNRGWVSAQQLPDLADHCGIGRHPSPDIEMAEKDHGHADRI